MGPNSGFCQIKSQDVIKNKQVSKKVLHFINYTHILKNNIQMAKIMNCKGFKIVLYFINC